MKRLTTYKREVERTEHLGFEYQTALNNIITEIKKDDNLSPTKFLDIVDCIQEIKKTRKRWATGTGNTPVLKRYNINTRSGYDCIEISGLTFTPSIILMYGPLTYNYNTYKVLMLNINKPSFDKSVGIFTAMDGGHTIESYWTISKNYGTSSSAFSNGSYTTERWIAIE